MLVIKLEEEELYNEGDGTFTKVKPITVRLEHSLISISRWESLWEKPFIPTGKDDNKTEEELKSYVHCMIIGEVPEYVVPILWTQYLKEIQDYIQSPNTATIIRKQSSPHQLSKQYISSELVYYWMIAFNIPFETQRWHLNRLLTLIDICNIKQQKQKPANKREAAANRRALNAKRRAAMNSKG